MVAGGIEVASHDQCSTLAVDLLPEMPELGLPPGSIAAERGHHVHSAEPQREVPRIAVAPMNGLPWTS